MKNKWTTKFFAVVLSVMLLVSSLPVTTAFAEDVSEPVAMTAGDVIADFAPAETECTSSDPSVAWVDQSGALNALKAGTATVTVPSEEGAAEYTVTVEGYSDGTPVMGNLKILARYNDNMQFYDGHVYLLFTSYQDGVTINVPDLYAGYEISDTYYKDINEDIANGSNHTGKDADKYFTFNKDMKSVTLDRGEIVTIGMYRDFDLSVPQAALGSIKNSSLWTELVKSGKSGIIETIFRMLDTGEMKFDIALEKIKAVLDEAGMDYTQLLDGVVDGGVCFNRELYNQKLEWDQYENVAYEMDITEKQLNVMQMYLGGNLNKFSILKNSCATVALRAWNAAVGTTDGEPNAYYLESTGEGIFALVDAPKTVRDGIVNRLPGYYLNNAEGVAEPDAGFQDDTGWVYVSAPEKVSPVAYHFADGKFSFDGNKTKMADLINAAKGDQKVYYNKDEQAIDVTVNWSAEDDVDGKTTINSIDFDVNGTKLTLGADHAPEDGIWFTTQVTDPVEGQDYYVVDANGKALASEYADGTLSFHAPTLPVTFKIVGSSEGAQNLLKTVIKGADSSIETFVYTLEDKQRRKLASLDEVEKGAKVYIETRFDDDDHLLSDITVNGESIFNDAHYDDQELAYFFIMPAKYTVLNISLATAEYEEIAKSIYQMAVGESVDVTQFIKLMVGGVEAPADQIESNFWTTKGCLEKNGNVYTAVKEGSELVRVSAVGNERVGSVFAIQVFADRDDMVKITYDEESEANPTILFRYDERWRYTSFSDYLVPKGSEVQVTTDVPEGKAILTMSANDSTIWPNESFHVNEDTNIDIKLADAAIENMPKEIKLSKKGDTYQLNAKSEYTGVYKLVPMYDSNIEYSSSDDILSVDQNGLITVVGEVPEDGAVAYIMARDVSSATNTSANTRVVIGDYKGDKVVGRLTIHARRIAQSELMAHASVTFTTYEDLDLDASYYEYYRPNDKYNDLMLDYEENPDKYPSDPALYNMDELGLEYRTSYFDVTKNGAYSDPAPISLVAGETITVSNYGFDSTNMTAVCKALKDSTLYKNSKECQALVYEMEQYINSGEDYDGSTTFDALAATLMQIYQISRQTGLNPADGASEGGLCIDRELYNQFRRNDTQFPNNYYTVEITADELAALKAYLANPNNNHYSFMAKNCSTGSVDMWNAVLSDKPELQLKGNMTGVATDPQSLYFDIGSLTEKDLTEDLPGHGGSDFYPRSVRYSEAVKDVIDKINAIGTVELTPESKAKIDAARDAFDHLNEVQQERVWNVDKLIAAEEAYHELEIAADKAAYEAYQKELVDFIDTMIASPDDSLRCRMLTTVTKASITGRPYDDAKSLDDNKAALDTIFTLYLAALDELRYRDNPYLGDVDLDRKVTIADATYILRDSSQMLTPLTLDYSVADTNEDGMVNVLDVTEIQRWLANMPANENIGKPLH